MQKPQLLEDATLDLGSNPRPAPVRGGHWSGDLELAPPPRKCAHGPWDLMAGQARAVATVLGAVKTARQARDRTAEVRWLKFWRLFSQIML